MYIISIFLTFCFLQKRAQLKKKKKSPTSPKNMFQALLCVSLSNTSFFLLYLRVFFVPPITQLPCDLQSTSLPNTQLKQFQQKLLRPFILPNPRHLTDFTYHNFLLSSFQAFSAQGHYTCRCAVGTGSVLP